MLSERPSTASSSSMIAGYEISDELYRCQVQVLERRYGGRLRAHKAATRIQRAFRLHRMLQQWNRLVTLSLYPNYVSQFRQIENCNVLKDRWPSLIYNNYSQRSTPSDTAKRYETELGMNFGRYRENACRCSNVQPHPLSQLRQRVLPRVDSIHLSARFQSEDRLCSSVRNERFPNHCPISFISPATSHHVSSLNGTTSTPYQPLLKLVSPRLAHRRIVPDSVPPSSHVWVPRSSVSCNPSQQSNSLPRLDKRQRDATTNQGSCQSRWSEQQKKRLYRIGLNFFNKKPNKGIQLLINWGFVHDHPVDVAKLLIERRGPSKQMIGEFLGTLHSQFHASVLEAFIAEINLSGMEIDEALRLALSFFRLPGEAQKIERIMQVISQRYALCNPDRARLFRCPDTLFILSFAIIMLNTDLHSPNVKPSRKMTLEDFIKNLRGIDSGEDIDRQLLCDIYERIRRNEFLSGVDHVTCVMKIDQSIIGKDKPKLVEPHRRLVCRCRLNQVIDPNKRQATNAHQREVFLFNDLMLVAKALSKKKSTQYTLRSWTYLLGLRIHLFDTAQYKYGITIIYSDGTKLFLNAKNDYDRKRFASDVKESVCETTEMEEIRIEMEMDKHSLSRGDSQRDSGLPDIDSSSNGIPTTPVSSTLSCTAPSGPVTSFRASQPVRRLSFNSLDSGVVEEGGEMSS